MMFKNMDFVKREADPDPVEFGSWDFAKLDREKAPLPFGNQECLWDLSGVGLGDVSLYGEEEYLWSAMIQLLHLKALVNIANKPHDLPFEAEVFQAVKLWRDAAVPVLSEHVDLGFCFKPVIPVH